jgi:DNA-binding CsgD family transcriptional regulator
VIASRVRPFTGRRPELARLAEAYTAATAGHGGVVLVSGEAGIGKSRLAAEAADRARAAGAGVLCGRCVDLIGAGLPYLPLVDALRPLARDGMLRELVELPRLMSKADPILREPGSQLRLFEEVLAVLDRLARDAPVVLVLEDLHWADRSTLALVAFLGPAVRQRRILVLATYRSDEVGPDDPLRRLVAELVRGGAERLPVGPFEVADLEVLLAGWPTGTVAAVHARTGGNPFYAAELVAGEESGTLPEALRDVLLQRAFRVDEDGRAVLRIAAAAGRDVPYRLLAAVAPLPVPRLIAALRQAVECNVLTFDHTTSSYRFRHALLAEAVYTTLLPGEREQLHERLARTLAGSPELGASWSTAAELAHHWAVAGDAEAAFAASIQAAREAEAVSGLAEALGHAERAAGLWPEVPDPVTRCGLDRPDLLAWIARLADLTGNGARAVAAVRDAIDGTGAAAAAPLYERLGMYLLRLGELADGLAAFERALALTPADPPTRERARVLAALGNALLRPDRYRESLAVCEEAIAVARALGDETAALAARVIRGMNLCYLGRVDEGLGELAAVRRRAEECGDGPEATRACVAQSHMLNELGRPAEAAAVATAGQTAAGTLGLDRSHGIALAVNAVRACIETGDWPMADRLLAGALRTGGSFWPHRVSMLRAELDLYQGRFDSAGDHLEAGAVGASRVFAMASFARLTAELALWQGRPEHAVAVVEDRLARDAPQIAAPDRIRLAAVGLWGLAEAQPDGQTPGRADALLAVANAAAPAAAALTPEAPAWLAQAEAEHARARGGAAPARWRSAVDAWAGLGRPYRSAHCRWRYADALLRCGSPPEDPAAVARQAYRTARELGAEPLRREVELLAQRARLDLVGLRPVDRDGQPDPGNGLGLTGRERQVFQLLARGYTNRGIAAELAISAKTASVHVSNILRKVGAADRLDAAALAQRLTPPD